MWPLKEFLHVVKRYGINSGSQEMSSDIYVVNINNAALILGRTSTQKIRNFQLE